MLVVNLIMWIFSSAALVDFLVVCANSSLIGGIYWGGQSLNQWNNKVNHLKQKYVNVHAFQDRYQNFIRIFCKFIQRHGNLKNMIIMIFVMLSHVEYVIPNLFHLNVTW